MPVSNLGTNIDKLSAIRENIREYEAKIKVLQEEKSKLEELVLSQLNELGLDKATGQKATVSITTTEVPSVQDWDKFHSYILRNKAFYLLERRAAVAAWREEVKSRSKPIPGVESFTKTTLNLRSL